MIIDDAIFALTNAHYIAGSGDGIVTVQGQPASRVVYLLDAKTLSVLRHTTSLSNGRYVILNLDPEREYMIMARDHKKEFEPFCWDYVKPAGDLTLDKLRAILQ